MTELCRALQEERRQMLKDLKNGDGKENTKPVLIPPEETIVTSAVVVEPGKSEIQKQQNCSESSTTTPA